MKIVTDFLKKDGILWKITFFDEVFMKRIRMKKIPAMVLLLCTLVITTVYADVTQDDIDNARDKISDLQNQIDEAEDNIEDISDKKDAYESDLASLNNQMSLLVADMTELEGKITDKQQEIADAKVALADAQEQCDKQYEDMKLRIQFMYENGNTSVFELLLTSSSFAEFLNKTEYISDINQYDRNMLVKFQELQADIEAQKETLETEETELLALMEDMKEKQSSMDSLIATTQSNISKQEQELATAQEDKKDIEAALAKMIEYEKELEIQKAKEDAARLEEIRRQEQEDTSGVVYVPTDSDLYLLGAIIQCESEGEPYEGKLAVGSVVMNRVKSSYFPNTISGVIFQKGQFSPVASGRYAYRLQAGVNSECLQAAQEVLDGKITLNCLFFRTNNGIVTGTVIGNHVFY